ncbi:hypothetical protein WICMUC_000391 [Wickerhamomyces mucosus]|uniref:Tyrosyl-DNA phosphodiesterase 1 n=1 Tax=Wickerhamomyces mucosus TaxID=1378264 RepID=A0A9P8PZZ4_9ASCO|nr:hypothetical protein WICMUC_000391 [Wickerhamomyces mucosus]
MNVRDTVRNAWLKKIDNKQCFKSQELNCNDLSNETKYKFNDRSISNKRIEDDNNNLKIGKRQKIEVISLLSDEESSNDDEISLIKSNNSIDKDIISDNSIDKDIILNNSIDKDIILSKSIDKDIILNNSIDKDIKSNDSIDKDIISNNSIDKDIITIFKAPFKPLHNPVYDQPKLLNSITISDILSNQLIVESYLFTYYLDFDHIMKYYNFNSIDKIHIICGNIINMTKNNNHHFLIYDIKMKPYTSHHCKLIINEYNDGTIKLFLLSCNLMPAEFLMNNQMIWESPKLFKNDNNDNSQFKINLIKFIDSYDSILQNGKSLKFLSNYLNQYDFSSIIGDFISSVPTTINSNFGYQGLINSLNSKSHMKNNRNKVQIVYQSSSIASAINYEQKTGKIGNIFTHLILPKIFNHERLKNGSEELDNFLQLNKIELYLIYPTLENIEKSYFGKASGTWSNFNAFNNNKSKDHYKMLSKYFYKPYSKQRTYLTSHTKYLFQSSDNFETLDWVFLTTANISKQAWGLKVIENFETGIFISKNHYIGKILKPVSIDYDLKNLKDNEIAINIPFDLPPEKYDSNDIVWCASGYN